MCSYGSGGVWGLLLEQDIAASFVHEKNISAQSTQDDKCTACLKETAKQRVKYNVFDCAFTVIAEIPPWGK